MVLHEVGTARAISTYSTIQKDLLTQLRTESDRV